LRHLAADLGADDVVGNRLEMKDRIATGKMIRPVIAGPTKAQVIKDHAKLHGFDLDDCYAFSDSYSDVPMLSVVGHPAAVNPDSRLKLLAEAYSWPIMHLT
jgi:phosphoserine phosphatase